MEGSGRGGREGSGRRWCGWEEREGREGRWREGSVWEGGGRCCRTCGDIEFQKSCLYDLDFSELITDVRDSGCVQGRGVPPHCPLNIDLKARTSPSHAFSSGRYGR